MCIAFLLNQPDHRVDSLDPGDQGLAGLATRHFSLAAPDVLDRHGLSLCHKPQNQFRLLASKHMRPKNQHATSTKSKNCQISQPSAANLKLLHDRLLANPAPPD